MSVSQWTWNFVCLHTNVARTAKWCVWSKVKVECKRDRKCSLRSTYIDYYPQAVIFFESYLTWNKTKKKSWNPYLVVCEDHHFTHTFRWFMRTTVKMPVKPISPPFRSFVAKKFTRTIMCLHTCVVRTTSHLETRGNLSHPLLPSISSLKVKRGVQKFKDACGRRHTS